MQLLDLKTARQFLWDTFSSLPYDESNSTEVAKVNLKINLTCERFFSYPEKFRGTLQRTVISAFDGQITLPRELQTVEGARNNAFNNWPLRIHPIWYEFIGGSCCLITSYGGLNDLGEGFCTFRDIPSDLPLVIRSAEDGDTDAVLTIVIQNGDGTAQVDVPLNVAATELDTPLAGKILRLHKPITAGRVDLFYVESGVETQIASLKPSETDANYRRYRVSTSIAAVDAICKRCFVPAMADIEPLIPNNIGAIKLMGMAIQFEDKNDFDRADKAMSKSIELADGDRQQFDGEQTPIYNVLRGFGAADIPHIGLFGYGYGDYVPGHYP